MQTFTTLIAFIFCIAVNAQAEQTETASAVLATPSPTESVGAVCRSHFSTLTQSSGANACIHGASAAQKLGASKAASSCKEKFPFSNRDELSCRIGVGMAQDLARSPELDKNKLKTCQQLYPIVTALDAYFQEACLAGAYSVAPDGKADIKLCQALSDDRAFVGPCVSGMSASITSENKNSVVQNSATEQNKACLQFFDKTQFHTGYRACLNSRALLLISESSKISVVKQCDLFTSNNKSETERAACIVGASIAKTTAEGTSLATRFKECGIGKVSYQGRDYLACLTAASLLHFMDKAQARGACQTIFSSRKTKSRGQCADYINKL